MSLIKPMIELVNQIPHGKVLSYGRLAEQLNTIRWMNEHEQNPSDGWKIDQNEQAKNGLMVKKVWLFYSRVNQIQY